jgi:hypothetical protein
MTRTNIAEWAYLAGMGCALLSLIFRSLFFITPLSVSLCRSTGVKPSSLLQLSVLCFVISIASRG